MYAERPISADMRYALVYVYKLFEDIEKYQQRDEYWYGAGNKVEFMVIWAHNSKARLMKKEKNVTATGKNCCMHPWIIITY